jgi:hypothetical protein
MKNLVLFSIILFIVNGACKEEKVESPYKDIFGAYDGESSVSDSTLFISYFCEGKNLMIKDLGDDNVLVTTFCKSDISTVREASFNEFKNLKIGRSKVGIFDAKRWNGSSKQVVSFSLIDIKTNKEVGYFYKPQTRPYFFYADSLLSTKGAYLRIYFGVKK